MTILFGDDPVDAEVRQVLEALDAGGVRTDSLERTRVDLKEEAGRRRGDGTLSPSLPHNEAAAVKLSGEAACMANSEGGGALVVGVADDHSLIGTDLEAEWLRGRIYDLTQRLLTVEVRPVWIQGVRLLIVKAAQALEPVRWKNKIHWRVGDRCVEVDATTWHARRMARMRYDWSAEPSNVPADHARAAAIESARQFLRGSGEDAALDLADARTPEFLRRLNVVTSDGRLTNGGVLAFVGRGDPNLDYIRRDVAGGDSVIRIRAAGRSLLEDLDEVIRVINQHNGVRHQLQGLVVGQVRELPALAVREAIVNGAVHREWGSPAPVTIEHVGRTLTVTSPGGFVGGVTPENIITHPSEPRNRALAELFAALRVAEREGIGVDRMVRDMLRLGYRAPDIREIEGPYIRAALVGDALDIAWLRFVNDLRPHPAGSDLNVLLLITRLRQQLWVDVQAVAPLLQLSPPEAEDAVRRLGEVTIDGAPLIEPVAGVPVEAPPAWHLSSSAVTSLTQRSEEFGSPTGARTWHFPERHEVALSWVRARGRISTTELGSIVGASPTNVGPVLRGLEAQGLLRPARANRRGAGFFYVGTAPDPAP